MKLTQDEQKELIRQAIKANTYICGVDGHLCGISRDFPVFPCATCKRNTMQAKKFGGVKNENLY